MSTRGGPGSGRERAGARPLRGEDRYRLMQLAKLLPWLDTYAPSHHGVTTGAGRVAVAGNSGRTTGASRWTSCDRGVAAGAADGEADAADDAADDDVSALPMRTCGCGAG